MTIITVATLAGIVFLTMALAFSTATVTPAMVLGGLFLVGCAAVVAHGPSEI